MTVPEVDVLIVGGGPVGLLLGTYPARLKTQANSNSVLACSFRD
jgi:flavin-dependent dehydrogenase